MWHKIAFLGLEEHQEFTHREIVLLNKLVFIATISIVPVIPIEVIMNGWQLVPYELFILVISMITLVFSYFGWHNLAKVYFLLVANVFIVFMGIVVGYGSGNELTLIAVFIAPSMLFKDLRVIILLSLLTAICFIGLRYLQEAIPPVIEVDYELKQNFRVIFQLITLIIVFFEIYYFKNINLRFQYLVLKKNEVIQEKNKEIVDSINYAQRIQDAYLPSKDVLYHYFPDSFLLFEPKDIVSGDFYWFYNPKVDGAEEDEHFVIAADCTGHGVPGAIMSVICANALNDVVVTRGERETGKILDSVRAHVVQILKTKADNYRKDGMDVALCRINKAQRRIQFSGAHNPLWLIRKGSEEVEVIKADKQPVGAFENPTPFTTQEINYNSGDSIYIFSDGYQDQFGGAKGKKFKAANLKKLLLEIQDLPMNRQYEKIKQTFDNWKADLEQVDDVVLIGIKF